MTQPLQQLVDAIRGCPCPGTQWIDVLKLAHRHRVIPLLHQGTHALIPSPFREQLERALFVKTARSEVLVRELMLLVAMFNRAAVRALPYKGPVGSYHAYGDTAIRQYDDLDFVIPRENILKAREILLEAGYRERHPLTDPQNRIAVRWGREWVFWHPQRGIHIDIKPYMVSSLMSGEKQIEELFARAEGVPIGGNGLTALSRVDSFMAVCLHGVLTRWSPIRQIADASALVQHADMDWAQVLDISERTGTTRIVLHTVEVARRVLGAPVPERLREPLAQDRPAQKLAADITRDIRAGRLDSERAARWYYKLQCWRGVRRRTGFIARQIMAIGRQAAERSARWNLPKR